ncbi:MAG: tetratricopeptide repeat protein [Thermodesulfobacteriota bacterium]
MRRYCWLAILLYATTFWGCFGNQAQEWYETAELEEIQNSKDHAGQLYRRIIAEYPDSEYARKAAERLAAMEGGKAGTTP